jgi:hypothetical protein
MGVMIRSYLIPACAISFLPCLAVGLALDAAGVDRWLRVVAVMATGAAIGWHLTWHHLRPEADR